MDKLLIHMRDGKLTKDELINLVNTYGDENIIISVKEDLGKNK